MYTRFPELAPPEIYRNPTADEVESGEWCFPYFRPDESNVTMLDPDLPVASQFANITPEYLWLQNERQTVVAVSGPHIPDPSHAFYQDLRALYGHFVVETGDKERTTLREGYTWPQDDLVEDGAKIIVKGGDALYLQSLAHRNGIECLSAEPTQDKDMLAVWRLRPDLRRATVMYNKMRVLPQLFKSQQQDATYLRSSILNSFRRFVDQRQIHHNGTWAGNHLYSINYVTGPGCLDAIGIHLAKAHGLRNDNGRILQGHQLADSPRDEIVDQIFRCTNSPVFHAGEITFEDLCEVQQVAVLVNRLRDRRIAYLLADLGRKAISYFWMSGPLHYETMLPGLRDMAAEQGLSRRTLQAELGLCAIRASKWAITQFLTPQVSG